MAPTTAVFPVFKAKVLRPVRKAEHIVYKGPGVKSFRFGNQTIVLKPVPHNKIRRFVPKKLMTPDMWRDMLKKAPPKAIVKAKAKEKRAPMKDIVLRAEKTIRIAQRDTLEDYCKEFCKEGLPGKKNKSKRVKTKIHQTVHGPARVVIPGKSKTGAKKVNFTVTIKRFEEYSQNITLGDPKAMYGQCASYTISLGGGEIMEVPEPTFEEIEVEGTINVPTEDEEDY